MVLVAEWAPFRGPEELPADVALEAAHDLAFGASFAGAAGDVFVGARVVVDADQRDGVERSVEGSVAAAVELPPLSWSFLIMV